MGPLHKMTVKPSRKKSNSNGGRKREKLMMGKMKKMHQEKMAKAGNAGGKGSMAKTEKSKGPKAGGKVSGRSAPIGNTKLKREDLQTNPLNTAKQLLILLDRHIALSKGEEEQSDLVLSDEFFSLLLEMVFVDLPEAIATHSVEQSRVIVKEWRRLIKAFNEKILDFIATTTNDDTLTFCLRQMGAWLPHMSRYPLRRKQYIMTLIGFWSSASDSVRITSILALRTVITHYPKQLDLCLKKMYTAFLKSCHRNMAQNIAFITFMTNSLVEAYSWDLARGYPYVFGFIRQLALTLRQAIKDHKMESSRKVCSWPYVCALRFWARLLSLHGSDEKSPLHSLLAPMAQLIIGSMTFKPVPQYFPFHFHCIQAANDIARTTGLFIPTTAVLLKMLGTLSATSTKVEEKKTTPYDFATICKVSSMDLTSRNYIDSLVEEVLYLLLDTAAITSSTITFPDLYGPVIIQMRKFVKESRNPKLRKQGFVLLEKIDARIKLVTQARLKEDHPPSSYDDKITIEFKSADDLFSQFHRSSTLVREQKRILMTAQAVSSKAAEFNDHDESDADFGDDHDSDAEDENVIGGDEEEEEDVQRGDASRSSKAGKTEKKRKVAKSPAKSKRTRANKANDDVVEDFVFSDNDDEDEF